VNRQRTPRLRLGGTFESAIESILLDRSNNVKLSVGVQNRYRGGTIAATEVQNSIELAIPKKILDGPGPGY